jgi:hypothetical protein
MNTLIFEPLIPLTLWASLALGAVALLVWYGRDARLRLARGRFLGVMSLMAIGVALPLVILLNPLWMERLPPPEGKPLLTVLVDSSASMATPDSGGGTTRYQAAVVAADALAKQLQDRFEIDVQTFAETTAPADPTQMASKTPNGVHTDLAAALEANLHEDRPQGQAIALLSDGIHNAGSERRVLEAAQLASAMSSPIFTQLVGGAAEVRDLAVEVRSPQELAFVGQRIPIRVILQSRGLNGATAKIELREGDKVVERRQTTIAGGQRQEVDFSVVHDDSGLYRYEVHVEPIDNEATLSNNQCLCLLRVVDEPIRVLLVEGNPYWDTKFLVRTLGADPSIELVSIVRLAENRFLERTLHRAAPVAAGAAPALDAKSSDNATADAGAANPTDPAASPTADAPASRRETWQILPDGGSILADAKALAGFQVVVLGRDADVYLGDNSLAELRRWVTRDGGSLVCFRGAPTAQISDRLRQFMPVQFNAGRESRFRMKLTDSGRDLNWIPEADDGSTDVLSQLPSLATHSAASDAQPHAIVWAVGESLGAQASTPVVSATAYGAGRVLVIEGAGMWRWAFLAPQFQRQEQVYASLWQSLIRWLVSNVGLLPTQRWSLRSDKTRFSTTENASATLLVRESSLDKGVPAIELTGGNLDQPQHVSVVPAHDEPGAYRVSFGKLGEGRYQAQLAGEANDPTARTIFEVRSHADEVLELTANSGLMRRISATSGGATLSGSQGSEFAKQLDEHLARSRPERVSKTTAWDRWWVLVGVFTVWTTAWGLRRASGLV